MNVHVAIDLGAESGRLMAVWIDGDRVRIEEVHRFAHEPVRLPSGLHWNITHIWQQVILGLQASQRWATEHGGTIVSIGCDAWGVDWALVDSTGELVAIPHAYRDPRNPAYFEQVLEVMPATEIYRTTGIQMMAINSLYSLYAFVKTSPHLAAAAHRLLFIPDLIHFWLSGSIAIERTIASTSQMLDICSGDWAWSILDRLGIARNLLGEIVEAGTELGKLRRAVCDATGLPTTVRVITPGSHDTASAVASIPATGDDTWAFLSSGTWSLLGMELSKPCVNAAAEQSMFTNEAGVCHTTRFLKNIAGLWLVQECRRAWQRTGLESDYAMLTRWAATANDLDTILDTNHPPFQQPGNMPEKIQHFAADHGMPVPQTPGEIVRVCLQSLAVAYRHTLSICEQALETRVDRLHIVGGGSRNELLNELTRLQCGRPVVAGPVEATAIGNGLIQAMACGELGSLNELRELVSRSIA